MGWTARNGIGADRLVTDIARSNAGTVQMMTHGYEGKTHTSGCHRFRWWRHCCSLRSSRGPCNECGMVCVDVRSLDLNKALRIL